MRSSTRTLGLLTALLAALSCSSRDGATQAAPARIGSSAAARAAVHAVRSVAALREDLAHTVPFVRAGAAPRARVSGLEAVLPSDARGPLTFEGVTVPKRAAFRVELRDEGASSAPVELVDGAAVYHDAETDLDVVWTATAGGVEELRVLRSPQAPTTFRQRVVRSAELPVLRARDGRVELVDTTGRVALVSPRGFAVDARGERRELSVDLEGNTIVSRLDPTGLAYPIVVDPTWSTVAPMLTARFSARAAPLSGRRAIVFGGGDGAPLSTVEIYDAATNTWTATTPLLSPRYDHAVTELTPGVFLVAGGRMLNSYGSIAVTTAERYDTTTSTPTVTTIAEPTYKLNNPVLATLKDGRVLKSGGSATGGSGALWGELWDPTTNKWSNSGMMPYYVEAVPSSVLDDGRVLVPPHIGMSGFLLYDPKTNSWRSSSPMPRVHVDGFAVPLKATATTPFLVLYGGGRSPGGSGTIRWADLWNPATDTWTELPSMLSVRGSFARATAIGGSGSPRALFVGGTNASDTEDSEIFDVVDKVFRAAGNATPVVNSPALVPMDDGTVLLTANSVARVWSPPVALGATCSQDGDCASGYCTDAVCCASPSCGPGLKCQASGYCPGAGPVDAGPETGPTDASPSDAMAAPDAAPDAALGDGAIDGSPTDTGGALDDTGATPVDTGLPSDSGAADTGLPRREDAAAPKVEDQPTITVDVQRCIRDAECATGHCVDGVCCDTACEDRCYSCALLTSPGKCTPQPQGVDLRNECGPPRECVGTCGGDGQCIGAGPGSQCARSMCVGTSTGVGPAYCTAAGARCPSDSVVPFDCAPYACDAVFGACHATCASSSDCAGGFLCDLPTKACVPVAAPQESGCAVGPRGRASEDVSSTLLAALALLGVRAARTRTIERKNRRNRAAIGRSPR